MQNKHGWRLILPNPCFLRLNVGLRALFKKSGLVPCKV